MAVHKVFRQCRRLRASLRAIARLEPCANTPMQAPTPSGRQAVIDHLLVDGMPPAIALRHRPIRPVLQAARLQKLVALCQTCTARLDLFDLQLQPCGHSGRGERTSRHARCLQDLLVLRGEIVALLRHHPLQACRYRHQRSGTLSLHLPLSPYRSHNAPAHQVIHHGH